MEKIAEDDGAVEDSQFPEEGREPAVHPLLKEAFNALERAGVAWCLLRVPGNLLDPVGDIDLLVTPAHTGRAQLALEALGFVRVPGQPYDRHFLSYHRPTGRWLWLHVSSDLSFGDEYVLKTRLAGECLSRRRRDHDWYVLAPDDALWALLLHCWLDKGSIGPAQRQQGASLLSRVGLEGPLARVVTAVCPPGWSLRRILDYAAKDRWTELEALAPLLRASWMARCVFASGQVRLRRALRVAKHLASAWQRRGLTVALIGPDGAGKSTLAMRLSQSFVLPVDQIYMGLTGGRLPMIDRLGFPPLVIVGRVSVFWYRYLLGVYRKLRGSLIVFDRYIYDAVAPPPHELNWVGRLIRWTDGHACPPPDLVLFLNVPGPVMFARKSEYSAEMLDRWRAKMLALQGHVPKFEIVDTSQSEDEVCAAATELIWKRYATRWSDGRRRRASRDPQHSAAQKQQ
ncbi:MAG TPA: hypothetical protein VGA61_08670 [Anaerolineae bacterium]